MEYTIDSLGTLKVLQATKIPIWVPDNIRIIDADDTYTSRSDPTVHSFGFCERQYVPPHFEFTIGVKPGLSRAAHAFTLGHEEGHLLTSLGELTWVYQEADTAGYTFPFFSKQFVEEHDAQAKRVIEGTNSAADYTSAWSKPWKEREEIANVAGLVGLIKSDSNRTMVNSVYEDIKNGRLCPFVF